MRAEAAGVALVLAATLVARGALPPYDDAFFFVRFARNFLEHGVFAWNVADGPVFGNTSQLLQLLTVPLRVLAPEHTLAASRLASSAALFAAVALAGFRGPALLLLLGPVGLACVSSGMETAWALLIGALALRGAGSASPWWGLCLPLMALARPDAALLVGATLVVERRYSALALGSAGVGLLLLAAWVGYGDPLPTAFATKLWGNDVYDATFLAKSREAKLRHLLLFAIAVAPAVAATPWSAWRRWGPAAAFVAFHALFTTDVMGMHARFFAPALPWLAAAAAGPMPRWAGLVWVMATAAAVGSGWAPGVEGWAIGAVGPWVYVGLVVAAWAAARPAAVPVVWAAAVLLDARAPGAPWRSDAQHVAAYEAMVTSFRGLDPLVRCLGPSLHVAHSEVGVPGMRLPQGQVTDLGGLMSPSLRTDGLDAWCIEAQPDAVFLPHRNYRSRVEALRDGRCLAAGYTRVVERSSSPLYVRSDHLPALRPCLGP